MQQDSEVHDDVSRMRITLPAYQEAVSSGDTAKAKDLASFIEDHFEVFWRDHRHALLELSLPALSSILSSDRLNIPTDSEITVWCVIEYWISAHRSERQAHLPLLFKKCLRLGRIPLIFFQVILSSTIYEDMSAEAHEEVKQHVAHVCGLLGGARSQEAIIDGRGLLYHKSIVHFRPRATRHLLIAAGGKTEAGNQSIDVYDPQLNMWRPIKLELPVQTDSFRATHFLDGVIYVFGRFRQSGSRQSGSLLLALDLTQVAPSWRAKAPMLEARRRFASTFLDGHLYVLGGYNAGHLTSCERYSPVLDRWEAIADLHHDRIWASAAAYKGRLYIARGENTRFTFLASVEVYSPASNTWLLVSSMASPKSAFYLVPFGSRLWAIGDYPVHRCWESYDSETDSWRQEENLAAETYSSSAIAFNDQLLICGGADIVGTFHLATVHKYDPEYGWTQGAPLSQARSDFSLFTVPNIYPMLRP